jgi:nucleoside-diphosphate-sugar epimerase
MSNEKMIVAITGSSGYLASALLPLLEEDKKIEKIIGLDIVPPRKTVSKLEHHNVSILDYPALLKVFKKVDCVVHMAFNINGMHNKQKLEDLNIKGSFNVIDAAGEAGVKKLVITSSIAAYGAHPDNPVPLKEDHPLRGKGTFFYSDQKHRLEEYTDRFEKKYPNIKVVRLRFCTTTGPKASNETVTLYTAPVFVAFPKHQPLVQLLHEDDAVSAFHLAIIKDVSGAFNIGSDWKYTAKEHAKIAGSKIIYLPLFVAKGVTNLLWLLRIIKFDPSWIKASLYPVVCDIKKAKEKLGWEPTYNSEEIIKSLKKKK